MSPSGPDLPASAAPQLPHDPTPRASRPRFDSRASGAGYEELHQQPYPSSFPPPPPSLPPDPAEARQGAQLVVASAWLFALGGLLLGGGCASGVMWRSQELMIVGPLVGIALILFAAVARQVGRGMQQ
ncbi:MAG: hypothetical protein KF819_34675 [Labilithrix sp.]|nr:hypothetical protein [Labilithrix sp.]